jgi:hypothetical protein
MVEKIMQINGTMIKIIFNKLSKPFAVLFSRLKTLMDIISSKRV